MKIITTKNALFLLLTFILFSNFTCSQCDEEIYDSTNYTATISPLQEAYNVGEEITISSDFDSFIGMDRGNSIDMTDRNTNFAIRMFRVEPDNKQVTEGIEDFSIEGIQGTVTDENAYYDRLLAKQIVRLCDAECSFEIKVTPQKAGIYAFQLLNSDLFQTECEHYDYQQNIFDIEDNNFAICSSINTTEFRLLEGGTYYQSPEDNNDFYFFEVK